MSQRWVPLADPSHRRAPGHASLAGAVLSRAVQDASLGLERSKTHHAHRWALISRRSADSAYRWLLGGADFWIDVSGIDSEYFRQSAHKAVEANRRKLAMKRIRTMGKVTEALAGVR